MALISNRLAAFKTTKFTALRSFSTNTVTPVDPKSIKWEDLKFGYVPTKNTVQLYHKDGKWDSELTVTDPYVKLHVLANVLHYGQAAFEGLKAFKHKDGRVAIFNPKENAKRMARSCKRLAMPEVPEETFLKACETVIKENWDYIPPYGSGGSFYMRPFIFGGGQKLGVERASEYTFGVIGSPVGLYYPTGLKPIDGMIVENYDRAAPKGVGAAKTAGNYAADIVPSEEVKKSGASIGLYLDAKEHKYIEEFSTSNFVAISKDKKTYITPKSDSILASITNIMLKKLAEKKGLKVETRKVAIDELMNGEFSEAAACGTAVIVTPIRSISYKGTKYHISDKLDVLEDLYNEIRALQTGDAEDTFSWNHYVSK